MVTFSRVQELVPNKKSARKIKRSIGKYLKALNKVTRGSKIKCQKARIPQQKQEFPVSPASEIIDRTFTEVFVMCKIWEIPKPTIHTAKNVA